MNMSPKGYRSAPGEPSLLKVPPSHWEDLALLDPEDVCRRSKAEPDSDYGYRLSFLNREILVDYVNRRLLLTKGDAAETLDDPLLALIVLVYLQNAVDVEPENRMTAAKELREGHFFTGVHRLDVAGLIEKFGRDPGEFAAVAESLGGIREPHADMSYRLPALPRVPLYYLLWEGDEDFEPNITVCFDRTIEQHFAADAIWGLVKRVSYALAAGSAIPD